jgi:predicted GIY-YIG superfamily endonuclease
VSDVLHTFVYGLHEGDHEYWYVGMTKDVAERLDRHRHGRVIRTRTHFTPDTQLYVLEEVRGTRQEVGAAERQWINGLRAAGYPLVNSEKDRPYTGPLNEATKAALSEAMRGKTASGTTRRKMSEAHCGRPLSDEHRRKIGDGLRGKPKSIEHNRKVSEARKAYEQRKRELAA